MCKIDAPFGARSLDEKTDPKERFLQALDEFELTGQFRSLLIEHFSGNWKRVFGTTRHLEETLKSTQQQTSDEQICAAFLSASPVLEKLNLELLTRHAAIHQNYALFDFAKSVALTYFSASPYALYSSIFQSESATYLRISYYRFVSAFYGKEYCFSPALFQDEALWAEGLGERNEVLWGLFNAMTSCAKHPDKGSVDPLSAQMENLVSAVSLEYQPGPPTRSTYEFLKGMEFLQTWVVCDAKSGRLRSESEGVFLKLEDEWSSLRRLLRAAGSSNDHYRDMLDAVGKWLNKSKTRLHEALYLHMDVSSASEEEKDAWAGRLNHIFIQRTYTLDMSSKTPVESDNAQSECLKIFCAHLSPLQIETWLQWSVRQDIKTALKHFERAGCGRHVFGDESRKWWLAGHSGVWKARFQEELSGSDIETRLAVLASLGMQFNTEAAHLEFHHWWKSLLENLIQDREFTINLIPQWTVAAMDRLDDEFVVPFIDKSIGVLRGQLSGDGKPELHAQLKLLLEKLDRLKPSKALRHRLMLMRSSTKPISDESVIRFSPVNSDNAVVWYLPLDYLANVRWSNEVNSASRPSTFDEYQQAEMECYEAFSRELVDFCLSRLRLRKGEKPTGNKYEAHQVTEPSAIWRQGYLKALLELGFDPKGKAHKTVYFTRQSDPDENVRAIAKECYRAVRRDSKKERDLKDLKRGLIAAEWWLLMSQRLELNFDVNYEEALRKRRARLRNP
ncbi:hypothetical protein [Marinobacter nauticus]|uniref:hypothetical protein n=1 Tax=Marinobacter nauticus TaxID=2743 RepID=UPI001C99FE40|nr:hypothetical protein [Marinobacter nauticus]MBY5963625.1 hypothetical protein [Marinobacter nauticus]